MDFSYLVDIEEQTCVVVDWYLGCSQVNAEDIYDRELGILLALMRANRARLLRRASYYVGGEADRSLVHIMHKGHLLRSNVWAARFISYVSFYRGQFALKDIVIHMPFKGVGRFFPMSIPAQEEQFVRIHRKALLDDIVFSWEQTHV